MSRAINIKKKSVTLYLMPGGKIEEKSDIECLRAEIQEELSCDVDANSLEFIGEYSDAAATPRRDVMIRLYNGKLVGAPKPSAEISALYWVGKGDVNNPKVSPIIRNKIIPDLVERKILK